MSILPLINYPATVVWVDDDDLLLKAATELLGNNIKIETLNSAKACLDYFENYTSPLSKISFLNGCDGHEEYYTINHSPVDLNTTALRTLSSKAERKNEVCILIVDYQMPGMTGIELCRHLKNTKFKKILLTGEANNELAIAAFNEGIIDCFIRKGSPSLIADIIDYLSALSNEFFYDFSKKLLSHLETNKKIPLSDPVFIKFFKNWQTENHINEHYIFDKHGNMEVIDEKGNKSLFVIHTDNTLNAFTDLHLDDVDAQDYVMEVNQRRKVPFFGVGLESWQYEVSDWSQYFYTPDVLNGREKYYWFSKKI